MKEVVSRVPDAKELIDVLGNEKKFMFGLVTIKPVEKYKSVMAEPRSIMEDPCAICEVVIVAGPNTSRCERYAVAWADIETEEKLGSVFHNIQFRAYPFDNESCERRQYYKEILSLPLLLICPYVNSKFAAQLAAQKVSVVDCCGNGAIVHDGLFISHTGEFSADYKDRRSNNPYVGISSLVARSFIDNPLWKSQKMLTKYIRFCGHDISPSQVSKTIHRLYGDLMLAGERRNVCALNRKSLLNKLRDNFIPPKVEKYYAFRITPEFSMAAVSSHLNKMENIQWYVHPKCALRSMVGQGGEPITVLRINREIRGLPGLTPCLPGEDAEVIVEVVFDDPLVYYNVEQAPNIRLPSLLAAYLEYHPATTLERHVLELAEQRILKQAAQSYMNFLREDEIQYLRNAWISSDAQEEANLL